LQLLERKESEKAHSTFLHGYVIDYVQGVPIAALAKLASLRQSTNWRDLPPYISTWQSQVCEAMSMYNLIFASWHHLVPVEEGDSREAIQQTPP